VALIAAGLCACVPSRPLDYFHAPDIRPVARTTDVDDGTPLLGDASRPPRPLAEPGPTEVPSFVGLVRRLSPSVVNVYTREAVDRGDRDPKSTGDRAESESQGTSLGSGLVLDDEGHLLTNAHVVENAAEIRIRSALGDELPAGLVGLDPIRDLALLKVDGGIGLVPVQRGDSDSVEVGQWVIAIGNPMGLSHTVTKGIVSGRGRSELSSERIGYVDLIQIDAPVNRGSSGGPLFDMAGRVVGVTTAIAAEGVGIGFAIGWNTIEDALPRLRQGGYVSRSWLGVYVVQDEQDGARVRVDAIVSGSPASRADLRPGDIIVALDDRQCRSASEFRLRVATAVAGRAVPLLIERDGKVIRVEVQPEEARDVR